MSLFNAIRKDVEAATCSQLAMSAAIVDYQSACIAGEWELAEKYRVLAVGSFEAFLDHTAVAHREIRRG